MADDEGAWSFDLNSWTTIAEQLGLAASAGPAGDPDVYLVQFDVSAYHGSVLVLDAASSEPNLFARLLPVPLGRQLGPAETPHATREQVVQTCGWTPEMATQPSAFFPPQTRCAARLLAGSTTDPASWSFDRARWHEAATRLGLDPVTGPAGDPLVYVIEADVSDRGGSIVVLNVTTAEPSRTFCCALAPQRDRPGRTIGLRSRSPTSNAVGVVHDRRRADGPQARTHAPLWRRRASWSSHRDTPSAGRRPTGTG